VVQGLRVERVSTAYDRADVLHDVSIEVEPGSITCLLGSNGSGKTTLIRSILGLTPPRSGQVWFADRDLTGLATHKVVAAGIACIPEGRKVFPKLTVEENLKVGGYQETSEHVVRTRLAEAYLPLRCRHRRRRRRRRRHRHRRNRSRLSLPCSSARSRHRRRSRTALGPDAVCGLPPSCCS
jgi:ABC-type branched-subunit amino acid transport system ATPase component